ncbi:Dna2/Cas4 domain-containing protein [Nocardia panacis]|uniref:Dna2/Cas4 domain-containing protein n=2 Tax=Nocardia panacis TaxID=2340916 RepID=A0A3A4KLJ5_9NOCA|nr:Dna2/Cas4 domain-containing protein [Nocardia panacis]
MLIWQESYFQSNPDTVRGDIAHQAVDRGGTLTGRAGARVWRSLPVHNDRLGMHGICDTVHLSADGPVPVEHKSGGYRPGGPADLQVAAQVLCLREMFGRPIPHGEVFAGRTRRRYTVTVDAALEAVVADSVEQLRQQIADPQLPPPVNDARCKRCSLQPGCIPEIAGHSRIDLFAPRPVGDHD